MAKVTGFIKELPGIAAPILWMVTITVVILAVLNNIPTSIQNIMAGAATDNTPVFKRYGSVQDVERKLDIKVQLPAYFPDYLNWPPAAVDASQKPVPIISVYASATNGGDGLILEQVILNGRSDVANTIKEPPVIKEELPVTIGETDGILILGARGDGRTQNQVRWHTEDRKFVLVGPFVQSEMLRIANSVR